MAVPPNTFTSYQARGNREGLSDVIWRQYSPTPGPRPPPPSPPPVLSNPAVIPSVTTAAFSVDSTGAGTIYYIVSTSTAQPTVDQMLSGHDANDFPAAASGLVPVTVAGTQTFTASGLVGNLTQYTAYFLELGPGSVPSNFVNIISFQTLIVPLPSGALGIWYMDTIQTYQAPLSPFAPLGVRNVVPNSASSVPTADNLVFGTRRELGFRDCLFRLIVR